MGSGNQTGRKASARGRDFWKVSQRRAERRERTPPRWETETRAIAVGAGQEAGGQLRSLGNTRPFGVLCVSILISHGQARVQVELPVSCRSLDDIKLIIE